MMAEMMAYSLEDSPRIRDAFTKCIKKHLVEKSDFDVMYEELNNTDIGKKRMGRVFILRGGHSSLEKSQELYDGIYKENDKDFVNWFNEIKRSLSRTANKNNGKHQEILEIFLELLQDSPHDHSLRTSMSSRFMSCKVSSVYIYVAKSAEFYAYIGSLHIDFLFSVHR